MSRSAWCRLGVAQLAFATLMVVHTSGCGKNTPANPEDAKATDKTTLQVAKSSPAAAAHLHKSFKDATVPEPPEEAERPPDKTLTGKNVAHLYEQITGVDGKGGVWDQVRFVTPDGQRIRYQAILRTDLGDMKLEFFEEQAPNHVRSFIALAKVGYFDGLPFHHILNTKVEDQPWTYIEAGCPLGTGDPGQGSIGYWLQPELNEKLRHEEGTVGASHGQTLESAACKFYISLTKAPWMDGSYTIFGKITQGLDVARKISQRPVEKIGDMDGLRPKEPVVIREVTVSTLVEPQVVAHNP